MTENKEAGITCNANAVRFAERNYGAAHLLDNSFKERRILGEEVSFVRRQAGTSERQVMLLSLSLEFNYKNIFCPNYLKYSGTSSTYL